MKKLISLSILICLCTAPLCHAETDVESLLKFEKKFHSHGDDFLEFCKIISPAGKPRTLDFECAKEMYSCANVLSLRAGFLAEELFIFGLIDDKVAKLTVRKLVKARLESFSESSQGALQMITVSIGSSSRPAVIAQGNKLKDDVKDLQEKLQALAAAL